MRILNVLSCLLDYPEENVWEAKSELLEEIKASKKLSPAQQDVLCSFVDSYFSMDLLDAQELYCQTFDVGHTTSLLIFEHIHGDSRDRGQAMVDLLSHYHEAGLTVDSKQLPDYLPLFLEFIAHQPEEEGMTWLSDIATILRLLEIRLEKKESIYKDIFSVLFALSNCQVDDQPLYQQVENEPQETDAAALDKIWEEEQVLFQADALCPSTSDQKLSSSKAGQQTPVYYIDMNEDKRSRV